MGAGISRSMALCIARQAGLSDRQADELLVRVGPVAYFDKQPYYLANAISFAIQRLKRKGR